MGEETALSGLATVREGTLAKVLSRGDALLNEVENTLSGIVPTALIREAVDQVMALVKSLGEVEIDVETAEDASRSFPEVT